MHPLIGLVTVATVLLLAAMTIVVGRARGQVLRRPERVDLHCPLLA